MLLSGGLLALWGGCHSPNPLFEPRAPGPDVDGPMATEAQVDFAEVAAVPDAPDAPTDVPAVEDAAVDAEPDVAQPDLPGPDASQLIDAPAPDLAPPTPELVAGLLGYWRFDEADGARTMRDSSGRGHDGIFEGTSVGTGFVAGKFGRAFELTTPDRDFGIRVAASLAIRAIQHYTLAAWVYRRRNTAPEYCGIISRQIDNEDREVFNMMVSKDYLKAYGPDRDSATGSVTTASTPTVAPLDVWFHAAATFDGTRIRIYQDGVEQGFDDWTSPLPPASAPLYLATKKVISYAHPFIGLLDEVLLYDRALPPEAIAALARGERPAVP
jgi:Concanavalin A-like lectin/glucanases superfamily